MAVKNPVLIYSSQLLNLADQHTLFFHFLASSGQQLFKTNTPILIESKFNCHFDLVIDLEIQRKHKEINWLVMALSIKFSHHPRRENFKPKCLIGVIFCFKRAN